MENASLNTQPLNSADSSPAPSGPLAALPVNTVAVDGGVTTFGTSAVSLPLRLNVEATGAHTGTFFGTGVAA